ncbi:hypothetical protein PHYBLDRAFT_150734 [Phycomyces blakesleeanus NRRL 1555(-)]|uniref:Uncharacterized protein n=1 Tax=Phycomyces blakesleeanus (strain ATCC 8743b / DSM 1359 / FGSC 10004 / NBRC 33097 / NRRL 1555) TaxID=763407 RepID=A0A162ZNL7_PHYB8|nr:hypothetical protein PHYBLDRAFT_150734 [Phycomyces blakesleeanus NRRL 1555(-)]OAD68061.1 hypothetical protein PHYBLDRAFT_150734 [Phycomyces blakesleeanus NRRL 1555(-)]|eukprot:XP_018286101.1 hypothetical protein PHYBLDRAFT_150734 [Phycomyces blakesleeanus NRRL 1555(-)]
MPAKMSQFVAQDQIRVFDTEQQFTICGPVVLPKEGEVDAWGEIDEHTKCGDVLYCRFTITVASTTQKPTHFLDTFYAEAYEKLFFPEFFITEQPRNWNAIAYLLQFVQKNPTIPTRSGNKALAQDTKIMQAYVISGTIADTMLRQMDNALKSAKGKSAIKEFWKNSASIASTSISYETSKYRLHGQMAEEIVNNDDTENTPNSGEEKEDEKEDNKEIDDIWESWKMLLKTIRRSTVLSALSKQVLRRPVLPVIFFRELNNQVLNITMQLVDCALKPVLYDALNTSRAWAIAILAGQPGQPGNILRHFSHEFRQMTQIYED